MAINGNDIRELTDNGLAEAAGLISRREYNLSIVRARQTAEFLVKNYASEKNIPYTTLADTIEALYAQGVINRTSRDAFHNIRIYGNKAVHDGDNDPDNAQKAYYLLKSEVSTFLSRKTVSVDRTPVRVGGVSDGRIDPDNVEIELEDAENASRRRRPSSTDDSDYGRNTRSRRDERAGRRSSADTRERRRSYDDDEDTVTRVGRSGSDVMNEEDEALLRDVRRQLNGGRDPERHSNSGSSDGRNARNQNGRKRSDAERRSGSGRNGSSGRNSGRNGGRNSGRNRNTGRNAGRRKGSVGNFTIYDLLRILIPIFIIILLIIIIRTLTASQKPVETTAAETTTAAIEETTTIPVTEPETTEPETTEAPVYEYRTNTDGVNVRYADNQNRIYTQLPANTNIGVVTPIEGSDFGSFTLDGVDVVVNMNFIEPIE